MSSVIVIRAGYLTLEMEVISVYLPNRWFISAYLASIGWLTLYRHVLPVVRLSAQIKTTIVLFLGVNLCRTISASAHG